MGTNTLASVAGPTIVINDPNQYRTALSGDMVPRTAGVPADLGGDLGSTAYRWNSTASKTIKIGATASNLVIEENSGDLSFKVNGSEKLKVGASGMTIVNSSIDQAELASALSGTSLGEFSESSTAIKESVATSTIGTSYVDLEQAGGGVVEVTLTTKGRPVLLMLTGFLASGGNGVGHISSGGITAGVQDLDLSFWRKQGAGAYSQIGQYSFSDQCDVPSGGSITDLNFQIPTTSFAHLDIPAAGTYTYKAMWKVSTAVVLSAFVNYEVLNAEIRVWEL